MHAQFLRLCLITIFAQYKKKSKLSLITIFVRYFSIEEHRKIWVYWKQFFSRHLFERWDCVYKLSDSFTAVCWDKLDFVDLGFILQFKEFFCIGVLFITTQKRVLGKCCFKSTFSSKFCIREWKAHTNLKCFDCWAKLEWSKKSAFLFIPLFLREREIDVQKIFAERANYLISRASFSIVFILTEVFCLESFSIH